MADTTIGALSVRITADTRGMRKGMKQSENMLQKGRRSLNAHAGGLAKWGAAGVAASSAIGAAIFKSQAAMIDSLAKTSDKLGIATEKLAGLRFAAEQTGVTTTGLDKALLKMTVGIAEATQGTGLAKDAIEELGLSSESLSKQTPDEALKTIADAMQGVEKHTDKVRIAYDLFGARGTGLINTLNGGSEALNGFQKQAESLGIALTRVEAAKVEQANDALNEASKVVSGVLQRATIELAPIVTALAKQFTDAGIQAGGMGNLVHDVFDGMIDGVGFVLDAIDGIDRTFEIAGKAVELFARGVGWSMLQAAEFIVNRPVEAVNELIAAMNQLAFVDIEPISLSGFGQTLKTELELAEKAITQTAENIHNTLMRPMPSEGLKKGVEEARLIADEIAAITAENASGTPQDEGEGSGKVAEVSKETAKIVEDLQNRYKLESDLEKEKFALENEALSAHFLAKGEMTAADRELQKQLLTDHEAALADIERQAAQNKLQTASNVVGAAADVLRVGGKKTEKLVRGLAVGEAIISGGKAAVSAFAAGMSVGGPFAPATAALYTAASVVNTGKMISKLKSGGKVGKPSGGMPKASGSTASGGGSGSQAQAAPQKRFDITIIGNTVSADSVRELMSSISEQYADGTEFNVGQA